MSLDLRWTCVLCTTAIDFVDYGACPWFFFFEARPLQTRMRLVDLRLLFFTVHVVVVAIYLLFFFSVCLREKYPEEEGYERRLGCGHKERGVWRVLRFCCSSRCVIQ